MKFFRGPQSDSQVLNKKYTALWLLQNSRFPLTNGDFRLKLIYDFSDLASERALEYCTGI